MKIWHQSFTDPTTFTQSRDTLRVHGHTVMGSDAGGVVHGLRPRTYRPSIAAGVLDVSRRQPHARYTSTMLARARAPAPCGAGKPIFPRGPLAADTP